MNERFGPGPGGPGGPGAWMGWGPGGPGFGPGGPGGPGGPFFFKRRGGRARRGDVRAAALLLLNERPMHGYEMIQQIAERSNGIWRPSPGSVYPHLQMLEDEGLLRSTEVDGSRTYTLTDAGRAEAEKNEGPLRTAGETDDKVRTLREALGQLASAAKQLAGAGEAAQMERGIAIIQRARKELYQILAED